jgi:cytochrome b
LGAGSVFAMLLILALQVTSGLFSDDEISNQGPLARFVSGARVSFAMWWHKAVGELAIYGLIALHVVAVLFYLLMKKENLIQPMIGGDKELSMPLESAKDSAGSRIAAVVVLAICAGFVYWVQSLGSAAY